MVILYWTTTALIALSLLWSAGSYVLSPAAIDGFRALGFPDYFRAQLVVLKLLAVPILLFPGLPLALRDWAYAGVASFLLTALVAHIALGDSPALSGILLVLGASLAASRWSLSKLG